MPFRTREEIEQRKSAGIRMNKVNCGWNLPTEITGVLTLRLAEFKPTNDAERRDKRILELAFIHDMNPQQIARLNDPEFVGLGNRSRGKPLSPTSIYDICMSFAPEVAEYRKSRKTETQEKKQRNALFKGVTSGEIRKYDFCATCGSKKYVELHHIIPVSVGGTDDYFNLISLCHDCHMKLHHRIYDKIHWDGKKRGDEH